jgi:hypothetical protein
VNFCRSILRSTALLIVAAFSAEALIVKPNVAPAVTSTIANYDQLLETTRVIDLTGFFKDPDASAAAQLVTPKGTMNFTLDGDTTPITVANFLNYVNSGRYFKVDSADGATVSTFFHRSIINFVIQGGGFVDTITSSSSATPASRPISVSGSRSSANVADGRSVREIFRRKRPYMPTSLFSLFVSVSSNFAASKRRHFHRGSHSSHKLQRTPRTVSPGRE